MTTSRAVPPLRKEQQAATRQRLLDAARECFISEGFIDTTVHQIVSRAGTSRATFYLHFRSKSDAIVATWNERELPEVDSRLRGFDEAGDFSVETTRGFLSELVAYLSANSGVMRSASQAIALEPELGKSWVVGMASASTEMPKLVGALGGDEAAADAVLLLIVQLERAIYFWMAGDMPISRDRLVEALARLWSRTGTASN